MTFEDLIDNVGDALIRNWISRSWRLCVVRLELVDTNGESDTYGVC